MSYSQLYVHLVWATWERSPLIVNGLERRLWGAIVAQCQKLGATPIRVGGMPDHVHVLAAFPPSLAISRLASEIKGASSHMMTHDIAPGRLFRWQEGYGAFTLRKSDIPVVARYIINQREHHARGSLSGELERSDTETRSRLQPGSPM